MSGIYLGRWDCPSCGRTAIAGDREVCPGCGQPRPKSVTFYLPEDAPAITDPAAIRAALAGPDWYCLHCGSANPQGRQDTCEQCGAPRGSSPQHRVTEYAPQQVPRSAAAAAAGPPPAAPSRQVARRPRWQVLALGMGGLLLLLTCVLTVLGLTVTLWPRDTAVSVAALSWERAIAVEQYQQLTEEDWSLPPDGTQISQRQAIRRYEQVFSHTETKTRTVSYREQVGSERYVCGKRDLGNGRFEDKYCERARYETKSRTETYQEAVYRDVPVYDTRYTYTIWRWREVRTERLGDTGTAPRWPEPKLGPDEREGRRDEAYTVLFTDTQGKHYPHETTQGEWETFAVGQRLTVRTNAFGTILGINKG